MKVAVDVHYKEDYAKAVAIEFTSWKEEQPKEIKEAKIEEVEAYVSGEFYKRELPCILKVLEQVSMEEVELIIVDGYVTLNDEGKSGLGKYLYEALDSKIPVIGVAKRTFKDNQVNMKEILRGESLNSLYITSIGMDLEEAAKHISNMNGAHRIPNLLRILDRKTKQE